MERPTRYRELGYRQDGSGLWRIISMDTGSAIGPHYCSKAELMGDLSRYAVEYGCEGSDTRWGKLLNVCRDIVDFTAENPNGITATQRERLVGLVEVLRFPQARR